MSAHGNSFFIMGWHRVVKLMVDFFSYTRGGKENTCGDWGRGNGGGVGCGTVGEWTWRGSLECKNKQTKTTITTATKGINLSLSWGIKRTLKSKVSNGYS